LYLLSKYSSSNLRAIQMRVSFDSNAWEEIFRSDADECIAIRDAISAGRFAGLICETAFRIEAVQKKDRAAYFAQPRVEVAFPGGIIHRDGKPHFHFMSIGPDYRQHPGLPGVQATRLRLALLAGIRLMRGLAWIGLPSTPEISDPRAFVQETESEAAERQQCQIAVSVNIWKLGVGKQAFDAAGGWQAIDQGQLHEKKFAKACAEWADGELAAAHVAYRSDFLCTADHGVAAGASIFNVSGRAWLASEYGVRFATLKDIAGMVVA
jgi:hypothetical protein